MPYYYEYVRLVEGGHIGDWYGYQYAGRLFRTQEEIIALKPVSSTGVQENYFGSYDSPGDAYLIDQDGDGKITAKDKVKLGKILWRFQPLSQLEKFIRNRRVHLLVRSEKNVVLSI